jgi:hypothetical protein
VISAIALASSAALRHLGFLFRIAIDVTVGASSHGETPSRRWWPYKLHIAQTFLTVPAWHVRYRRSAQGERSYSVTAMAACYGAGMTVGDALRLMRCGGGCRARVAAAWLVTAPTGSSRAGWRCWGRKRGSDGFSAWFVARCNRPPVVCELVQCGGKMFCPGFNP